MKVRLNIGLLSKDRPYPLARAVEVVNYYLNPVALRAEQQIAGNGEPTVVIELSTSSHPAQLANSIALVLGQDCIAFEVGCENCDHWQGFLIGPNAAAWGGRFNKRYWLKPTWA